MSIWPLHVTRVHKISQRYWHCCQVVDSVRTHGALQASTCLQGNVVQLTFVKYNFTYLSQFQALGLQGEASYWFCGHHPDIGESINGTLYTTGWTPVHMLYCS